MKLLEKMTNQDAGIFLVRLALALVFIVHGYAKLINLAGTEAFFEKLGLPVIFVYLVTFVELFGGLSMLFGILSRIFAGLLAITMIFAIYLVKLSGGFLGGYEFDLVLLLISLSIVLAGPGKYVLLGRKRVSN